jgi:hypothetical protein
VSDTTPCDNLKLWGSIIMSGVVEVPDLIEPVPVQDDFIQGIARIERVGPCVRFILYAEQTLPELGNAVVKVVVRKIVVPLDAVSISIAQAVEFMSRDMENPKVVRFPPR